MNSGSTIGKSLKLCALIFIILKLCMDVESIAPRYQMYTVAGYGTTGSAITQEIRSTSAGLNGAHGIFVSTDNNLYFCDSGNSIIRKVTSPETGLGTMVAIVGTGTHGTSENGTPATAALVRAPCGVWGDSAGNIYFSDGDHQKIKKITSTGILFDVGGTGGASFSGEGTKATSSAFNYPALITGDTNNMLYIADSANHRVRKINLTTGIVTTIAGTGSQLSSSVSGPASSTNLNFPYGVAVDTLGKLHITENDGMRVRVIINGIASVFAGTGIQGFNGDGIKASSATISGPTGVWCDSSGNVFVSMGDNACLRMVDTDLTLNTVAGSGGTTTSFQFWGAATSAPLLVPDGVYGDAAGRVFVSDAATALGGNAIRGLFIASAQPTPVPTRQPSVIPTIAPSRVPSVTPSAVPSVTPSRLPTATPTRVPSATPTTMSPTVLPSRVPSASPTPSPSINPASLKYLMYTVAGTGTPDVTPVGAAATSGGVDNPGGLFVLNDNLLFCDSLNYRVRKINNAPSGTGASVAFAGTGTTGTGSDNIQATSSKLVLPGGIWGDSAGNVYVSDYSGFRIKKVAGSGIITNLSGTGIQSSSITAENGDGGQATAATLFSPAHMSGTATSAVLYFSDRNGNKVRKIDQTTGIISRVIGTGVDSSSGSAATSSTITGPYGIFVDSAGVVYINEAVGKIRKISAPQITSTFAGTGTTGYEITSGVRATSASISGSGGVWGSLDGRVFFSDALNSRVRMVDSALVYTVAGTDSAVAVAFVSSGVATSVALIKPDGLFGDSAGRVYVGDMSPTAGGSSIRGLYLATVAPSNSPTVVPTRIPSIIPTTTPTRMPSLMPSRVPTWTPSNSPTTAPSRVPSVMPSRMPTFAPSRVPSAQPTVSPSMASAYAFQMYTVAGTGEPGSGANKLPATSTLLNEPMGVFCDLNGTIFVADNKNFVIRKLQRNTAGVVISSVYAGTGVSTISDPSARATSSGLKSPTGLWGDSLGNLYISDQVAHVIKKVDTAGIMTRVAGTLNYPSTAGEDSNGDNGNALYATFNTPVDLSGDSNGFLYIADMGSHKIRILDVTKTYLPIYTFAGSGLQGSGGDGLAATLAPLNTPCAVFAASNGVVYITELGAGKVRKVTTNDIISTFAGFTGAPYSPSVRATSAGFGLITGIWGDSAGNVFIADSGLHYVHIVETNGFVFPAAGMGSDEVGLGFSSSGPAKNIPLLLPSGITGDAAGRIYVTDYKNTTGGSVVRGLFTYSVSPTLRPTAPTVIPTSSPPSMTPSATPTMTPSVKPSVVPTTSPSTTPTKAPSISPTITPTRVPSAAPSRAPTLSPTAVPSITPSVTPAQAPSGVPSVTPTQMPSGVPTLTTALPSVALTITPSTVPSTTPLPTSATPTITPSFVPSSAPTTTPTSQAPFVSPYQMATYAGTGMDGIGLMKVKATASALRQPGQLFLDDTGVLFIAGGNNYRVSAVNDVGTVLGVAGTGSSAPVSTASGPATSTALAFPTGVWGDSLGNIYVCDNFSPMPTVRKVGVSGIMFTYAGTAATGSIGDGGPATSATFYNPSFIFGDTSGNVLICDMANNRIRQVDAGSQLIRTLLGDGTSVYNGDNVAASSARVNSPYGIFLDTSGNIYFTEMSGHRVKMLVASTGRVRTMAGTGGTVTVLFDGVATGSVIASPSGVWVDQSGKIFAASGTQHRLRQISYGVMKTIVGSGSATASVYEAVGGSLHLPLINPSGVVGDNAGRLFVASRGSGVGSNVIRLVNISHVAPTLSPSPLPTGQPTPTFPPSLIPSAGPSVFDAHYLMETIAGVGLAGTGSTSSNMSQPATSTALKQPMGVYVDSTGVLFVCDTKNYVVRKIVLSTGEATVFAGTGAFAGGTGDGLQATSARFSNIVGVWGNTVGTIFISDSGANRIRYVGTDGIIRALAGSGAFSTSATDLNGDSAAATAATLNRPSLMANGGIGNIIFADQLNHRIRKVAVSTGIISNIAGNGVAASSGDGGKPTAASFNTPYGLSIPFVGGASFYYVTESAGNRVRKFANLNTPIATVAGNGGTDLSDNVPATSSGLIAPAGVWSDSIGNTYFVDSGHFVVRKLSDEGMISTVAGSGQQVTASFVPFGAARSIALLYPFAIAGDDSGRMFVSDASNSIGGSVVRFLYQSTAAPTSIPTMSPTVPDLLYSSAIVAGSLNESKPVLSKDTSTPFVATEVRQQAPKGVWPGSTGDLYLISGAQYDSVLYSMRSDSSVWAVAGLGDFTQSGVNNIPATSACLTGAYGVWGDILGNLYVTEETADVVRKIDSLGIIYDFAGQFQSSYVANPPLPRDPNGDGLSATAATLWMPHGLFGAANGVIYIADTGNHKIRAIHTATGIISTVAGNGEIGINVLGSGVVAATTVSLTKPMDVWVDSVGVIYISDSHNYAIRKVVNGILHIFAGSGSGESGYAADGMDALWSEMGLPTGITGDVYGNIFIADKDNSCVRVIHVETGKWGTVSNYSSMSLKYPEALGIDSSGSLYVGDDRVVYKLSLPTPSPTAAPTAGPSLQPTAVPSFTTVPSMTPTTRPSALPSSVSPTTVPTLSPTVVPSTSPSRLPTTTPTITPTSIPTKTPTMVPTTTPTISPTVFPTTIPTRIPSMASTSKIPTLTPTLTPTLSPTVVPTTIPSVSPTRGPTTGPTFISTSSLTSAAPSAISTSPPSGSAATISPTVNSAPSPSGSSNSLSPSVAVTFTSPSAIPTAAPTEAPTTVPTQATTTSSPSALVTSATPSLSSSTTPSQSVAQSPSGTTCAPSMTPTATSPAPVSGSPSSIGETSVPSIFPSGGPTNGTPNSSTQSSAPTTTGAPASTSAPNATPSTSSVTPTVSATVEPTTTSSGTSTPSNQPNTVPVASSISPSAFPSTISTVSPSVHVPTSEPLSPSTSPSTAPSVIPSSAPSTTDQSAVPSSMTTDHATTSSPTSNSGSGSSLAPSAESTTVVPSSPPVVEPTTSPSASEEASSAPSSQQSAAPTAEPSNAASSVAPTFTPSIHQTLISTAAPSAADSISETPNDSFVPTIVPSTVPSMAPSAEPSAVTAIPSSPPVTYTATLVAGTMDTSALYVDRPVNNAPVVATASQLHSPQGIWLDSSSGAVTVVDLVDPYTVAGKVYVVGVDNIVTVVAGCDEDPTQQSSLQSGVAATSVLLSYPVGVWGDSAGNLFVTESYNHVVRRVDSAGQASIVAGLWSLGSVVSADANGDGGPATSATLYGPTAICGYGSGVIYFADTNNHKVRSVDISTGLISTIAGSGAAGSMFVDSVGEATSAALSSPQGVWADSVGRVFISDTDHNLIRFVHFGMIGTIAGRSDNTGLNLNADSIPANQASISTPRGIAGDSTGNIYFAEYAQGAIRVIYAENGFIDTIMRRNDSLLSTAAEGLEISIRQPLGVQVGPDGGVFFSDRSCVRRMDKFVSHVPTHQPSLVSTLTPTTEPSLEPSEVPSSGSTDYPTMSHKHYKVEIVAGATTNTSTLVSDATYSAPATRTRLSGPQGLWSDDVNRVLYLVNVLEYQNNSGAVYRIAQDNTLTVVAGFGPKLTGAQQNIAATSAFLYGPMGIVGDSEGSLFIAEVTGCTIKKVDSAGIVTVIAGQHGVPGFAGDEESATGAVLRYPAGVCRDPSGDIFFSDSGNARVRRINMRTGAISTVVGSTPQPNNLPELDSLDDNESAMTPATSVTLVMPLGLWIDSQGTMYLGDAGAHVVYKVSSGMASIIVGTKFNDGWSGDNLPATQALINTPTGIWGDSSGNLYFCESVNNKVRIVYAQNGLIDTLLSEDDGADTTTLGLQVDISGSVLVSDAQFVRKLWTPTEAPTQTPTATPSDIPSILPTEGTKVPSLLPTTEPTTAYPSVLPTLLPTVRPSTNPTIAPSRFPTVTPSRQPSKSPSMTPTTALPTLFPTTVKPSRTPSIAPTRLPTVFSSVIAPTVTPTAQPTSSQKDLWTSALQSALYAQSSSSSAAHQSTYYELLVTDASPKNVYGSCASWSSLLNGDVSASIYSYKPSAITLTVSESLTTATSSVTCSDATKVSSVLNHLISGTATIGSNVVATCDTHSWVAKTCAAGNKALCVDCPDPCTASAHCKKPLAAASTTGLTSNYPFVIAPCVSQSCAATNELSACRVLSVSYNNIQLAPDILSLETVANKTSVVVTTKLSAQGAVYCGAFPNSVVPTSVDEVTVQNFAGTTRSSSNTSVVTIYGLNAVSRYAIYCLTSSSVGVKMSVAKMLSTRTVVSTACCKTVTATLASSVLQQSQSTVSNLLSIALDALPSGSLQISLKVTSKATNSVLTNGFFPSTFTVNSVQSAKSFAASLYSLSPGIYTYALVLSGTSASEFEVVYGSKELTVLGVNVPPPAPVLSSAAFSNEGTSIIIKFDSSTNKAGTATTFNCGKVFDFLCASSSSCRWSDAATVEAKIMSSSIDSCIVPGGDVSVTKNVALKAACIVTANNDCSQQSAWQNASSSVVVKAQSPVSAINPTVVLAPRSVIGACDSLTIDFTASYGSGGRDFGKSVVVTSSDVSGGNNTAAVQWWLDTKYRASPPNAIPQSLLTVGTTYNFVVTLCNFLQKCGQNNLKVTVISADVPSVSLPGETLRTMTRSQVLSVVSEASISRCGSVMVTNLGLSYRWSVSVDNVPVLGLVSSSRDSSKLLLSSYALQTGTQYEMTLLVTTTAFQSASAVVKVLVVPGPVMAVIANGATGSVRVGRSLVIDASPSRDDDQPGISGLAAGLEFAWSCTQTFPSYAETCQSIFDYDVTSGDQMLTVTAKESASNAMGVLIVVVFDSTGKRSSQATITLTVLPALAAVVSLASTPSSAIKMNAGQVLKLTGSVGLPVGECGNVTWSVDDSTGFNIFTAAQSAVTSSLSKSTSIAPRNIYIAFAANALPVGATLTFSLTCVIPNSVVQSVAKVTVNVNSPPQPGTFYVDPLSGTAVETPFTFVAEQWTDVDMPITYQFGYYTSSGSMVVLRSQKALSFGEMTLIPGVQSNGRVVSCVAQIFDSLEADSIASFPVTVQPGVEKSATEKSSFITDSLYQGSGSVDGRKLSTAMASYLLNTVDCSSAPDCAALHRHQCSKSKNTCGVCIAGFVGEVGDSNSACVDSSAAQNLRRLSSSDGSCTQATDCSSVFANCVAGKCAVPNKTCTSGCSGHGTCSFVSAFNNTQTLTSCAIDDLSCAAVCDCDEDYSLSASCAVNNEDTLVNQASREAVLSSIVALTEVEDPSEQSVSGLISLVSIATQNTDELSSAATDNAVSAISTVVDNAATVGVSAATVEPVLDAMNSVVTAMSNQLSFRRRRLLSTDGGAANVALVQTLLQKYSAHIASTLLPGMSAVSSAQSHFKLSTQYVSADMSVSLPLTSLEALSGLASSSVTLPENSTEFTAVSVLSLQSQLYGDNGNSSSFISNPLNLLLSSLPCASPPCEIRIVLQNTQPVTVRENVPEQHNTTCFVGERVAHNYTCSNGYVLNNITCDGVQNYVIHSKCPVTNYSPVCNTLTGSVASENSGCRVIEYSDSSVTCGCPVASSSSRRVLQSAATEADDGSYSVSYVSMLKATMKTFTNTFSSAEGLNASSAEDGWEVIVTIGVFAAAIIVALAVSHNADVREKTTKEHKKEERKARRNMLTQSLMKVAPASGSKKHRKHKKVSTKKIVNAELAMVEQSLPKILSSSQSFSEKFFGEIKQHHRWLGVVFFFSESFPRALRVASLATNVIIMLFIQSITYNLTNPDDGTCEAYLNPTSCAEPKSPYATGESKCEWSADDNSCSFLQPDASTKIVLFVAIFSAIISTPIALTADWVLHKIVSAPITSGRKRSNTVSILPTSSDATSLRGAEGTTDLVPVVRSRRRRSVMELLGFGRANQSVKVASYQLELTNLANDVRRYRESLTVQQRVEFDLLWGLDENGCFKTGERSEGGVWSRMFGLKKGGNVANVHQAVLNDLKQVEETVTHELERYPTEPCQDTPAALAERKGLNHKLSKRLLFLFQCDLLPGISGQILQSKSSRDATSIQPVSYAAYITGCVSLIMLNTGMLFYIFLFALQQSKHRQSAWFQSFMVWLVVEILLVSTAIVFLMHVVIPSLIMKDVTKIKNRLLDNIRDFHANIANKANKYGENKEHDELVEEKPFNAAKYLFVSTRVAAQHPELREAAIISQFSTPWPKQSYQHVVDTSKAYSKKFSAISRSVSIIVLFFVTNLLNVPPSLQDMVVHMVTTTTIGYTALLHIQLFGIFPVLAFGPFIVVCVIVHFVIQSGKASAQRRLAQLLPQPVDVDKVRRSKEDKKKSLGLEIEAVESQDAQFPQRQRVRTISEMVDSVRFDSFDLDSPRHHRSQNATPVNSVPLVSKQQHVDRRASLAQGVQVLQQINSLNNPPPSKHSERISDKQEDRQSPKLHSNNELWNAPLSDSDIDPAELEQQRDRANVEFDNDIENGVDSAGDDTNSEDDLDSMISEDDESEPAEKVHKMHHDQYNNEEKQHQQQQQGQAAAAPKSIASSLMSLVSSSVASAQSKSASRNNNIVSGATALNVPVQTAVAAAPAAQLSDDEECDSDDLLSDFSVSSCFSDSD